MTREALADIIREELDRHQPCGTRLLCDVLDNEHGIDLEDSAVEAILRWLAAAGVRRAENGKWSLLPLVRPREQVPSVVAESISPGEAAGSTAKQSPMHLRTIERLRSGLPPIEAVEELSLDYSGSLATIRNTLDRVNGHGRWLMVRGNYGTGKTHFLQVFRSLALSRNYASCYLCTDNGTSALNHPLRFLPSLLATMEIPQRPGIGYADLLRETLLSDEGRHWLRKTLERWKVRSRQPFTTAIHQLDILISETAAGPDEIPSPTRVTQIIEQVFGRSVSSCSSTLESREVAYSLLLLAGDVVKRAGGLGIALLIDEAESVFTKLPTILSRSGALRVLSALCEAPRLSPVIAVVATTPDAYTMLRHEMDLYDTSRCHPDFEPMSRLRRQIADGSHGCVDCEPPKGSDLRRLLDKIREFYLCAYPNGCLSAQGSLREWDDFASSLQRIRTTPRLMIRRAIDFLDTERYRLC